MSESDSPKDYGALIATVSELKGAVLERLNSLERTVADLTKLYTEVGGLKTEAQVLRTQLQEFMAWRKENKSVLDKLAENDRKQDDKLIYLGLLGAVVVFILQLVVSVWITPALQSLLR